jgi:hypothetical protein
MGFSADGHRMVCIPEKLTLVGSDQGSMACRYHWSTRTSDKYNCYVQFIGGGTKIAPMQLLQYFLKSKDIYGILPAQQKLKVYTARQGLDANGKPNKPAPVRKDNGDFELTTKAGSPAFIVFSEPFDEEHFMNLKKANEHSQLYDSEYLGKLIGDLSFVQNTDELTKALPCLGCVDLDAGCIKK